MSIFSLKDWQRAALTRMFITGATGNDDPDDIENTNLRIDLHSSSSSSKTSSSSTGTNGGTGSSSTGTVPQFYWSDEWKILIYDTETKNILSPILSVHELRSLGVTLHIDITSPRDPLPDVSAVYFIRPTPQNIRTIVEDAATGKYRDIRVHFVSPISSLLLEDFARGCVEMNAIQRIKSIIDSYQSYISLEHKLFTLYLPQSYTLYSSPSLSTNEQEMETKIRTYAQKIAESLLSICGTTGIVPLLICNRGGPSEFVTNFVDEYIRDHISSSTSGVFGTAAAIMGSGIPGIPNTATVSSSVHTSSMAHGLPTLLGRKKPEPLNYGAGNRPVFLILDRDIDLATPLWHPNTYQALLDDTLGPLQLNRIFIPDEIIIDTHSSAHSSSSSTNGTNASQTTGNNGWLSDLLGNALGSSGSSNAANPKRNGKYYTLDADTDAFWRHHAIDSYPNAIEANEQELSSVSHRETQLRKTALGTNAMMEEAVQLAALNDPSNISSSSGDLITAINSLPELLKRKKILETHTTIMNAIMKHVSARTIPEFETVELDAINNGNSVNWNRSTLLTVISDNSKGIFDDRLRTACIYFLTCPLTGNTNNSTSSNPMLPMSSSSSTALDDELRTLLSALQQSLPTNEATGATTNGPPSTANNTVYNENCLKRATYVLQWIKRVRLMSSMNNASSFGAMNNNANNNSILNSFARVGGNLLSKATAQVNKIMGNETRLPITRIVAAICEGKPNLAPNINFDNFGVYDPRFTSSSSSSRSIQPYTTFLNAVQNNNAYTSGSNNGSSINNNGSTTGNGTNNFLSNAGTFRNAFVCMVGGGTYAEAHDIYRYATGSSGGSGSGSSTGGGGSIGNGTGPNSSTAAALANRRTIIYGGTEILNPSSFLYQLEELGKSIQKKEK